MLKKFFYDETGAMTLEAAIITAALVALAIVFRKQLSKLWDTTATEMHDMEEQIENS